MKTKILMCLIPILGFVLFCSCDRSTDQTKFIGNWINEDENTRGITKAVIRTESDSIFVHMWGKCHPTDCDWGEESTTNSDANDNQLSLEWNQGFVIRTQKVTYLESDRLRVEQHSHYIDNSGRPDRDDTYYFIKTSD